jgi:ubiquinone/menaquinone biosynthesis C-methylase UbiE
MALPPYIMESKDEIKRLEAKTRGDIVVQQARWAGLKPGHKVVDIGCGPGKTTSHLYKVVQPGGTAVGVDTSSERIQYAREHYKGARIKFVQDDFSKPLEGLGQFDFIWVRFVLEYFRASSFDIVKNLTRILKPGGILCLIDIDHNCMNYYGLPPRLDKTIRGVMEKVEREDNFDPYVGRKLYSYLYDLNFTDIDVNLSAHHLIYGPLDDISAFNWRTKVDVGVQQSGYRFEDDYPGGYDEFYEEFDAAFKDERRFIYTPLISCRGKKPDKV